MSPPSLIKVGTKILKREMESDRKTESLPAQRDRQTDKGYFKVALFIKFFIFKKESSIFNKRILKLMF